MDSTLPVRNEVGLDSTQPIINCSECGQPHAGWSSTCFRCQAQQQRENDIFRRLAFSAVGRGCCQ